MGFLDWLAKALSGGESQSISMRRMKLRATAALDANLLNTYGLPYLRDRDELADAMGIPRPMLDWLTFPDTTDEPPHYISFAIPKASGGYRVLYAPKPRLKQAQRWVLRNILDNVRPLPTAHGFNRGHSIHTNAAQHTNKELVVTLDLQDFFPSITYRRVRGIFQSFGYSEATAIPLAMLCTVKPAPQVREFLGHIRHRMLPQGAPTSPALANLACRNLDARLTALAQKLDATYTRYADDITLSGNETFACSLKRTVPLLRRIIEDKGFRINPKKTHFARQGARQKVTGLVVNQGPSVPRLTRRRLRAILHNAQKTGLEAQNLTGHPHFAQSLRGQIEFIGTTHPDLAARMLTQLNALG